MKAKGKDESESDWIHTGGGAVYRSAVRYLIDGEWHPLEAAIQQLIPKVHPAKAARYAERARRGTKSRKNEPVYTAPEQRVKHIDLDRIIRIGARAMSREALRNRAFEVDNERGMVRIRPNKLAHAKLTVAVWETDGGEAAFHDTVDED